MVIEALRPQSHRPNSGMTVTIPRESFSIQIQGRADLMVVENLSEPDDLVSGFQKGVITKERCMLLLNDILNFPDCFRRHVPNTLQVPGNE